MKQLVTFIGILFVLSGCATDKPQGKTEAEVLYKEALQLVEEGHYLLATERLNSIKSQYPYSYYATHAELLLADILFDQELFVESAAAYILFRDFHPRHKKIGYVLFRIAESYFFQMPSTYDRDLAAAFEAIKYYKELLRVYPQSSYIKTASGKIKQCKAMIESKEQYIADFYFKTKSYGAAIFRYKQILQEFASKELRDHSMIRIVETSLMQKKYKECVSYVSQFEKKISKVKLQELQMLFKQCNKSL